MHLMHRCAVLLTAHVGQGRAALASALRASRHGVAPASAPIRDRKHPGEFWPEIATFQEVKPPVAKQPGDTTKNVGNAFPTFLTSPSQAIAILDRNSDL